MTGFAYLVVGRLRFVLGPERRLPVGITAHQVGTVAAVAVYAAGRVVGRVVLVALRYPRKGNQNQQ